MKSFFIPLKEFVIEPFQKICFHLSFVGLEIYWGKVDFFMKRDKFILYGGQLPETLTFFTIRFEETYFLGLDMDLLDLKLLSITHYLGKNE